VLFSGDLALFDLGLLRDAWKLTLIKDGIQQAAEAEIKIPEERLAPPGRQERKRLERERKTTTAATGKKIEQVLEIVSIMPHAVQASVSHDRISIWCTLQAENLIVPASELLLKHDVSIPGRWAFLGILDAFPSPANPTPENDVNNFAHAVSAAMSLGTLWQMISAVAVAARSGLGRPDAAYGATPLLIFREVAGYAA